MAGLRIEGLRVSRDGREVLRGIDLDVGPGRIAAVLGASGAGKSTLLRTIAGLERPDAGTVLIDGVDVTDVATPDRDVAMVSQQAPLDPTRDVRSNLGFPLRLRRVSADETERRVVAEARAFSIADLLGRLPGQLSEGERHAAATAKSLVRSPRLLLLDEPLADLDPPSRARAVREIRTVQEGYGAAMLVATNDQAVAATLADTVVVLVDGTVAQSGTYAEVHDAPRTTAAAELLGDPPMLLCAAVTRHEPGRTPRLVLGDLVRPTHDPVVARLGDGRDVTVGIRAEHVEVADRRAHGTGEVTHVGLLGPDGLVQLHVGGGVRLTARIRRPLPRVGDVLPLRLTRLHVYAGDGRLLTVAH